MRTIAIVLFTVFVFVASVGPSQAAFVPMEDRQHIHYDKADDPFLTGELSASDSILTWGFSVEPGERFFATITAPQEFYVFTKLTTAPDFGGSALVSIGGISKLDAGESVSISINGNYPPEEKWLSVGVDQVGIDAIDTHYGGSFDISGYHLISEDLPNQTVVPLPAALWLMLSSLAMLLAVRRRRLG